MGRGVSRKSRGRGTNISPMLSAASDTVVLDLKKEASQGVLPPCLGHTWLPPGAVSYGRATTPSPGSHCVTMLPNLAGPWGGDQLLLLPHAKGQGTLHMSHVSWAESG